MDLWALLAPGQRYQTSSVETLRWYALSQETERVRLSSKRDGTEAEFRVDGPEGRLVWHEVSAMSTLPEVLSLNEICQQSWRAGKLEVVQI